MNIYYAICADAITQARSVSANKNNWKRVVMTGITIPMVFNFVILITLFQKLVGLSFYNIHITVFPTHKMNSFCSGFILYVLPIIILNYFFLFYKNRYEKIVPKYKTHKGKLFATYLLGSSFIMIISLVCLAIFYK